MTTLRDSDPLSPNNHLYKQRHIRVIKARGKASEHNCIDCDNQAHDWSQMKGNNGESIYNYEPRCISCHRKYDADSYRTI